MSAQDWDSYWQGTENSSTFDGFGPQTETLQRYWYQVFQQLNSTNASKVIDIACGNGTVCSQWRSLDQANNYELMAVDYSLDACSQVSNRVKQCRTLAADVTSLPLHSESFDVALSQFGIEYGSYPAFAEAWRILKKGGHLALLCHVKNGAIFNECYIQALAATQFQETKIMQVAIEFYRHVQMLMHHTGSQQAYKQADSDLARSVQDCKSLFKQYGKSACGGLLWQSYAELGKMYSKLKHYDPKEVIDWLLQSNEQIDAYIGRMHSMMNASMSKEEITNYLNKAQISDYHLTPLQGAQSPILQTKLASETASDHSDKQTIAWSIRATKSAL